MRTVLFGLILLAVGKVWFQDHSYRTAMSDAVVEAYRDRAIEICRRTALRRGTGSDLGDDTSASTSAWGAASKAEAVIGNPDISVAIWDTENPLWNRRFHDPHLVLTSTNSAARCAYDVRQGGVTITASTR